MSLTLIFDSKQMLYAFRNSHYQVPEFFDKLVNDVQTGYILTNYRSPKQLVVLSNLFSDSFKNKLEISYSEPFHPISEECLEIMEFDYTEQEVSHTAERISELHKIKGVDWKDISILARTNKVLENFEAGLISNNIPYVIKFDSRSILRQSAFRLIFSYYSLMFNPKDLNALEEVTLSVKGLGRKFSEKIKSILIKNPDIDIFKITDLGEDSKQFKTFYRFVKEILIPVREIFMKYGSFTLFNTEIYKLFDRKFEFEEEQNSNAKFKVSIDRGYLQKALKTYKDIYRVMADDIEFKTKTDMERFIEVYRNLELSLEGYERGSRGSAVMLSTVHSFKGKQSDYIFFVSLKGNFKPVGVDDHEEKCCFYVAVTRAKKCLYLYCSDKVLDFRGNYRTALDNPFLNLYRSNVPVMKDMLSKELVSNV